MAVHLGHLVQSPSGISRLRDLAPPSLGFFVKPVSWPLGGGVTAGSTLSRPRVFLVKEVVAIKLIQSPILTVRAPPSRRKLRPRRACAGLWRRRWWSRRWLTHHRSGRLVWT